jgi:uncharacterized protein DUF5916/cellulose/xylan binding protein with CBM9 domain
MAGAGANAAAQQPVAQAVRIAERLTIDGRLDEPAWELAQAAGNFIQWEPDPGMPSSEKTEVRFLYNDDNLYIGARCWDSDPRHLTIHELRQDFESRQSDTFAVFLDSLHDRQSGFSFWTNPAGARRDVQIFQDDAQRSVDWDGVWDVKTTVDEQGWTAEFVIPFKTLRFSNAPAQEWGLNMLRRIRRRNEDSYWSPLPRRYSTMRASIAGTLTGFENIRQGRNLKIKPSVVASVTELAAAPTGRDADGGLDVKYGLSPSMTLDLTYRTDFSQVEVDQQQVNLTRFNLLFPEKREFFLENSGLFTIAGGRDANVYPFFSRRIGLSASGTPIPIVGGARMSGTRGNYDLGVLAMRTEGQGGRAADTFAVGRLRRNFRRTSAVGAIVTSRQSAETGDSNRLYGVDTLLRFFNGKLETSSFLMRTETPALRGRDQARLVAVGWNDDNVTVAAQYDTVQPNFNPEVGFVRRRNMTRYASDASWRPRPRGSRHVRNFTFAAGTELFLDEHGFMETREQAGEAGISFHNSSLIAVNVTNTFDRLAAPFAIRPTVILPAGDYEYLRYALRYNSNLGRAVSGNVNVSTGEFWDGRSWAATGGLDIKPNHHLNVELSVSRNQVELPAGDFTTTIVGLRLLYAFTSNAFFNSFLQYNATTSEFNANTRVNIIHRPLSDLYVVFNEQRDTTSGALRARGVILKFTNLFDF